MSYGPKSNKDIKCLFTKERFIRAGERLMSKKLTIMAGLPRSGKSTLANRWVLKEISFDNNKIIVHVKGQTEADSTPRIVINADQIRMELYGQRFYLGGEQFVHAMKMLLINMYYKMGYHVLVDGTHTTEHSLKELFAIDKTAQIYIMDIPAEECERRAIACGQGDLVYNGVIDRMAQQLSKWKNNKEEFIKELIK